MLKILKALQNVGFVLIVDLKVRDHWYVSGKCRSAAHRDCNNTLREKYPNTEFFLVRIYLHLHWIRRFIQECYTSLSDKGISDKEYQSVLKVWNKFQIKAIDTTCI